MAVIKSKYLCGPLNYASLSIGFRWFQVGFVAHDYGLRIMAGWYQWVVMWPRFMRNAEPQTHNTGSTQRAKPRSARA
jgi:hypothetical protein